MLSFLLFLYLMPIRAKTNTLKYLLIPPVKNSKLCELFHCFHIYTNATRQNKQVQNVQATLRACPVSNTGKCSSVIPLCSQLLLSSSPWFCPAIYAPYSFCFFYPVRRNTLKYFGSAQKDKGPSQNEK